MWHGKRNPTVPRTRLIQGAGTVLTWHMALVKTAVDVKATVIAGPAQVKADGLWAVLALVAPPCDGHHAAAVAAHMHVREVVPATPHCILSVDQMSTFHQRSVAVPLRVKPCDSHANTYQGSLLT